MSTETLVVYKISTQEGTDISAFQTRWSDGSDYFTFLPRRFTSKLQLLPEWEIALCKGALNFH
jgi:hypothetical protein